MSWMARTIGRKVPHEPSWFISERRCEVHVFMLWGGEAQNHSVQRQKLSLQDSRNQHGIKPYAELTKAMAASDTTMSTIHKAPSLSLTHVF